LLRHPASARSYASAEPARSADEIADGVRQVLLQAQDQALALCDFLEGCPVSLESPQLGDVAA
jgi:hypothetical protein